MHRNNAIFGALVGGKRGKKTSYVCKVLVFSHDSLHSKLVSTFVVSHTDWEDVCSCSKSKKAFTNFREHQISWWLYMSTCLNWNHHDYQCIVKFQIGKRNHAFFVDMSHSKMEKPIWNKIDARYIDYRYLLLKGQFFLFLEVVLRYPTKMTFYWSSWNLSILELI